MKPLLPLLFTYVISFQTVGTYWNNHHHLFQLASHVSASIMWANLHLLFWLSLIPFASGWLGENHGGHWPTAVYSFVLLMCGVAYSFLQARILAHSEKREQLWQELKGSPKGLVSLVSYGLAIVTAFFMPVISDILIVLVALMWFIPDRRIEKFI